MAAIPKVVAVLSGGIMLCLGLSIAAQVGDMKTDQSDLKGGRVDQPGMPLQKQIHVVEGVLVRVEYGHYVVKDKDGKEVQLATDSMTQMMGQIKKGDRIVAKVNDQNHALSISPVP